MNHAKSFHTRLLFTSNCGCRECKLDAQIARKTATRVERRKLKVLTQRLIDNAFD